MNHPYSNPASYMYASEDVPTDSVYSVNATAFTDENYPYPSQYETKKRGHRSRDPYANMKSFGPSLSIDSIPLSSPLRNSHFNAGNEGRGGRDHIHYEPPHPYGATYTSHLAFDDDDVDFPSPPSHTTSYSTTNSTSRSSSGTGPQQPHPRRYHHQKDDDARAGKKKSKSDGDHDGGVGHYSSSTHLAPPTLSGSTRRQASLNSRTILRSPIVNDPHEASPSSTQTNIFHVRTGRSTSHTGTTRPSDHDRKPNDHSIHSSVQFKQSRKPPGIMRFASEHDLPRHGVRFVKGDVMGDDGWRGSYVERGREVPGDEFWEGGGDRERERNRSREMTFEGEDKKTWKSSLTKRIRRASHNVKSFFSGRVLRSRSLPTLPSSGYYEEPRSRSVLASSWPPATLGTNGSGSPNSGGYTRTSQLSLV